MEPRTGNIGESLREAREQLGLTLKRAEAETRIRARYLAALEEERWEELPGDAYVRGFLRSYAQYLGLDGSAYLAAYRARTRRPQEPSIAPVAVSARRRSRTGLGVAVAAAALAAVALGAWQLDGRSLQQPAVEPAPAPTTATAPAEEPAPQPEPEPEPPPAPPATAIVLRAVGEGTTLEVRVGGPGGRRAWTGTLREGQTLRLGLRRALFIRVGTPRNLRATIGGERQPIPAGARELVATRQGVRPRG